MEVLPGEKDKFKHAGGSAAPTSASASSASSSTETYKRKLDAYHTAAFERVNKALKLSDTLSSKNAVGGKTSSGRVPGSGPQTSPASDAPSSARRSDGGGSTGGNFSPTSSLSPRSSPGGGGGGSRPSSPGAGGADLGGPRPRSPGGDPRLSRALSRSPSPAHSDHSGHSCPSPGKTNP